MAFQRPDVLVMGVGGTLGIAWLRGLLAGVEQAHGTDLRDCEAFVGTSAGSVLAAALAGGTRPTAPGAEGRDPAAPAEPGEDAMLRLMRFTLTIGAPVLGRGRRLTGPAGAALRAAALRAIPRGSGDPGPLTQSPGQAFDGRLRVIAVDRATGRRVVFGEPGAPKATVAQAVRASCAVPWIFRPAEIGGREYVDGGVWSPTNLDVAPGGRGTRVLCLVPSAGAAAVTRTFAELEAAALRRRGAEVRIVGPDSASRAAAGRNPMDPRPSHRVMEAGYRQGLALP